MSVILIVGTACVGLGIFFALYAGEDGIQQALGFIERDLADKLRQLRISTKRLRRILVTWFLTVFTVLLVLALGLRMPVLGLTLSCIMVTLPWFVVRRMAQRRQERIEDQLADAMVSLSSAIKAGLSLPQSLEILAQQAPRPIVEEFQQMVGEYHLGKPLEVCLDETRQRLKSENFALFAAAMEASRQSGGRLNDTVERIAHSVRELQRLERKIISETAQARASAFYMALAPAVVLALYYFLVDPENTERLFTTVWGQVLMSAAVILNVVAYLWARVILNPEI